MMAEQNQQQGPKQIPKEKEKKEASIVRIADKDINGSYKIARGIMHIKGIGYNMASAISLAAERLYGIKTDMEIGSLDNEQLENLEKIIKEPGNADIPNYLLNRRNDRETGRNIHFVGTDLIVSTRQDIENDIKLQTWRGFRHQYKQKVRGQRTRSTGRTGATVGVSRKGVLAAQKEQIKQEKK